MRIELGDEIEESIRDYSVIFPPPYALAPNLGLASEALAALYSFRVEAKSALDAAGLPSDAGLVGLIRHHRVNAALAAVLAVLAKHPEWEAAESGADLTDEEWKSFEEIPAEGYDRRAWIDARIRERVEAAQRA